MSVFEIYKGDGGAKFMRPIHSREEYLQSRNSEKQQLTLKAVRSGEEGRKSQLIQMNYSCLPNEDGTLKGSKRMSSTVGMDIDHITAEKMQAIKERILKKKDELGLLMLEESARGGGYHLVFKRRAELDQVGNLKWASELLEVAYDAQAKDITRVFFTTTEAELIYLDDTKRLLIASLNLLQCCSVAVLKRLSLNHHLTQRQDTTVCCSRTSSRSTGSCLMTARCPRTATVTC